MLLNEFLKDHRRAREAKDAEIAELKKRVAELETKSGEITALKQHLTELEAKDKEREARVARLESLLPSAPAPVTLTTATNAQLE